MTIKNAEIVVVPTHKPGTFAVMSRDTYEATGTIHTRGDVEVGWDKLEESQREVNGHVSMLIKIFKMVKNLGKLRLGKMCQCALSHFNLKTTKGGSRRRGRSPLLDTLPGAMWG